MNNQEKYQLWLNQYKAIQSSELSIERWAIQNNLPPSTVYSRIHRLCQLGLIPKTDELTPVIESDSSSSCFVEISVPDSIVPSSQLNLSDTACRIELANRTVINITNSISPVLLQKIMETVIC